MNAEASRSSTTPTNHIPAQAAQLSGLIRTAGRFAFSQTAAHELSFSAMRPFKTSLRKEFGMPKIVITHAVTDVENWLMPKAERVSLLSPWASHVTDHVAMDGSNNVAVTADVHDMAAAQATVASPSPELAAAMDKHGVISPLSVHIEK
jgi:hypothetical protein